jgi:hypothetical protein
MAAPEARDYYYDKGRLDYSHNIYDQPFPCSTLLDLDDFELLCNASYAKGFNDERDGKPYCFSLVFDK